MELGRSMVEMLGVLAIIGVLSIVGIQGYKKAMLKHKANELMNLASILYNETKARAMLQPDKLASEMTAEERNKFKLYLTASDNPASTDAVGNMGIDKPSFMTHNYFNILVNLVNSTYTGRHYSNQPYHAIRFFGMNGNCDLCEALKSLTEKSGDVFRYIPGSKNGDFQGIRVYCFKDGGNSESGTSCYKAEDTY